jgi:hypothetical protein
MSRLPTPLDPLQVTSIKKISPRRPVFLVTLNKSENYVVKRETGADIMARKGTKATLNMVYEMTETLLGGTKGRTLNSKESDALVRIHPSKLDAGTKTEFDNWIQRHKGSPDVLVLMNLIDGLTELGAVSDQAKAIQILHSLQTEKNLKRLGHIIAVDLFTGNQDRFMFAENYTPRSVQNLTAAVGKKEVKALRFAKTGNAGGAIILTDPGKVICNVNNIVFKPVDGYWELIGFDPYDPNCQSAKLATDLAKLPPLDGEQFGKWSGVLLLHSNRSWWKKIATNALLGIKLALLRNYPDSGLTERTLYTDATDIEQQVGFVVEGLDYALSDITRIVKTRINMDMQNQNNPNWKQGPGGLASRATALGWMKN